MGLTRILRSKRTRNASAITMLVEAGMALRRGKKRLAVLFLGAAALAYRWSGVGILLELLIRGYQWLR